MSDPFTEFAVQTQSTLSSLGTLLEEHETAMRDLDREISEQDLDTYDAGTIYRMKVCAEKRAILEENREEILDNISQNEVMLSALRRISHLEVTCSGLQDQLKLMMSEGEKVREQLEETRQLLEQSQERVVSLEGEHEEIKFLATISSRAEAALTGSLEVSSGTQGVSSGRGREGGEDKSAHMHMDDSTESSTVDTVSVSDSVGAPVPDISEGIKQQMTIVSDYGKKGNYDIAVNLSKKALEELTLETPQCKVDRAVVLNTLALLYREIGKPTESISLLKEALLIREQLHGADHISVASIANNLAIFYSKTFQYELAEESCKKALTVKERVHGVDSVEVARQVSNLALICQSRNKFEEAEFHFMRALDIYQTGLGGKDKSVLKTMTELGQCYLQQKRWEEAETFLKKVVSRGEEVKREVTQGNDTQWTSVQPVILQCIKSLKELYLATRNTDELKLIEKTLLRLSNVGKRGSISRAPAQSMLPKLSNQGPSRGSPTPPIPPVTGIPRSESRGSPGPIRPVRVPRREDDISHAKTDTKYN